MLQDEYSVEELMGLVKQHILDHPPYNDKSVFIEQEFEPGDDYGFLIIGLPLQREEFTDRFLRDWTARDMNYPALAVIDIRPDVLDQFDTILEYLMFVDDCAQSVIGSQIMQWIVGGVLKRYAAERLIGTGIL